MSTPVHTKGNVVEDHTMFPVLCPGTGKVLYKLRKNIVRDDLIFDPSGHPQAVLWQKNVGPDLFQIEIPMRTGTGTNISFPVAPQQRLCLRPEGWPKRCFENRTDTIIISWVNRNLLRQASIPLQRISQVQHLWNIVGRTSETLTLPLEVYSGLPDDKKRSLRLLRVKPDLELAEVPFSTEFLGYGEHHIIGVSGSGLFVSADGLVFSE